MNSIVAKQVMTPSVTTIAEDAPIREAIQLIEDKKYSGLPVVNADGVAVGLISQNDILRALAYLAGATELPDDFQAAKRKASKQLLLAEEKGRAIALSGFLNQPVRRLMSPGLHSCATETAVEEVCKLMIERRIHRVAVLDSARKVVGLISATDLVRCLGEELRA